MTIPTTQVKIAARQWRHSCVVPGAVSSRADYRSVRQKTPIKANSAGNPNETNDF